MTCFAVGLLLSFFRSIGVCLYGISFFCVVNSLGTKIEIPFRFIEEWDGFLNYDPYALKKKKQVIRLLGAGLMID